MTVNLTRAERVVLSQVINIKMNMATLKDHILLEGMFKALELDAIKMPVAMDFVPEEKRELFFKYEGKQLSEIESEEDKKIISEAIQKQRVEEMTIWNNEEEPEKFEFSKEQLDMIKAFFEQDKRPFPREYHKAIVALHGKVIEEKK